MAIVVEAIYEDGVLKPATQLALKEGEKVRLTVDDAVSRVQASYGLLNWQGDPAVIERIALDPEYSVDETRWKTLIECDDDELIERVAIDPELDF